jgi:hypothetical protein
MPLKYELNALYGLEFSADTTHAPFGYLTAAKINQTTLGADLAGTNPLTHAALPAVAVLSSVEWNETALQPVLLTGYVSAGTMSQLAALIKNGLGPGMVSVNFAVYQYDSTQRAYLAFAPQPAPLQATLVNAAEPLKLTQTLVHLGSVQVYQFSASLTPGLTGTPQGLAVSAGPSSIQVYRWGTSVPGSSD